MKLRVKEICKQRGIQLKELAEKMGIAPESLTRAINGNPQLSTLESMAIALEVDIKELFSQKELDNVTGYLEYHEKIVKINSLNDLRNFIQTIDAC